MDTAARRADRDPRQSHNHALVAPTYTETTDPYT